MRPYYSIEDMGDPMVFGFDEKCLVEVNRNSPQERYRYEKFIKGLDKQLYDKAPRELKCSG